MTNVLVTVTFRLNVSEEAAAGLMGRLDDGSDEWYQEAAGKVDEAVMGEPFRYIDAFASGDPEVSD